MLPNLKLLLTNINFEFNFFDKISLIKSIQLIFKNYLLRLINIMNVSKEEILMKAKLMSYNQIDFQSKAHMKSMIKDIEEQVEKYGSQMKKAGLVSFVLTQIWNKQGKFRLGSHFSYRDEKAFVACQKILNGIPQDEDNPTVTNADRGIVLLNFGDEQ